MSYFTYMRISTDEERGLQKYNRQERALQKYAEQNNIEYFTGFKEDKSGKNFTDRKEFNKLVSGLNSGDTIVFKDITRFTRQAEEGYKMYMELFNKGINLVFIDNPTISTDYIKEMSNIVSNENIVVKTALESIIKILLMVELDRAERERTTLQQRIKDGIKASHKTQGRKKGQLDKLTPELTEDLKEYRTNRAITIQSLMAKHNLSRNTIKKYLAFTDEQLADSNS